MIRSRPDGAALEHFIVERGVFSDARSLGPIIAESLTWRPRVRAPDDDGELRFRLSAARRRLESQVGRLTDDGSLVVYDGLLHSGPRPMFAVGMAKRAYREYLPAPLAAVARSLRAGERTPLFVTDAARGRHSFYLALADPLPPRVAEPSSGIARIETEVAAGTPIAQTVAFADRVAATLPAFASEPHHDPRAPQNLAPIRGLEDELRRLLGRPSTIRPLLAACAAATPDAPPPNR